MSELFGKDIEEFIPHRASMRLVERVQAVDDETIETSASVLATWPTVEQGHARTLMLIEVIAQSAAALMRWRQRAEPGPPGPGFLVGIPSARYGPSRVPVGTQLSCRVRLTRGVAGYCAFDGEVQDETGRTWARASVQAFRPDESQLAAGRIQRQP